MRSIVNLTEDWKEMTDAVSTTNSYLGMFGLLIDTKKNKVDVSNEKDYERRKSSSGSDTKSLKSSFVIGLFTAKEQSEYDCMCVMCDRQKSLEDMGLYGQCSTFGNKYTIEVYAQKGSKPKMGFPHMTYSLIHEHLHMIARYFGVKDTLHDDVKNRRQLDEYLDVLLDRILAKFNTWGLLPAVGDAVSNVLSDMKDIDPMVVEEGHRSAKIQQGYYDQPTDGKDNDGDGKIDEADEKITNAKPWESMHQFRIAADIRFVNKPNWPTLGHVRWEKFYESARKHGLYSYGKEEKFDAPHVQLMFGKSEQDIRNGNVDWARYWLRSVPHKPSYPFTRDLEFGMTGQDVLELQKYLNDRGFLVAVSGSGSKGNETTYFGDLTRNALARYQKANNISPAVGYFGPITRKNING